MILELFVVLIAVALLLVWLGYYMEMSELAVVGFVFLFLLSSFVLLPKNLEYRTGETETYSYMCLDCVGNSLPDPLGNTSVVATKTTVYDYDKYDDNTTHYVGYFLSIISALGMIFVIVQMRGNR